MQTYLFVVLILFALIPTSYAQDKVDDKKVESDKKEELRSEKPEKDQEAGKTSQWPEEKPIAKDSSSSHSGEIFVIRNGVKTEVFFRNHNQSYFIPKDNKHNARLKNLQKRSKLNQQVTIQFNPKTREISDIQDSKPALPSRPAESSESSPGSSSAH